MKRKKLSPREQALRDIRESGLSFNSNFDRGIRKFNAQYQDTYDYYYKQLILIDV